tara:strand:- start:312 stop:530 length:219 start_codon:yes stop_codon:yes gene_type:complete
MKDKFLDALLKNGFSTVLSVVFCYSLFYIMQLNQERTEEIRKNEIELFKEALKIHREHNDETLEKLIECLDK